MVEKPRLCLVYLGRAEVHYLIGDATLEYDLVTYARPSLTASD